nr:lipocalin/fatty-acid binding family protein [uncultured Moellerella sp.]
MNNSIYGRYKLSTDESYDEFLKAVGVSMMMRKMLTSATPVEEISRSDDFFIILIIYTFKTTKLKFQLNDKFIYNDDSMGIDLKYKMQLDGNNKLIQTCQLSGSSDYVEIIRKTEDSINMRKMLTYRNITSTQTYTRL